jgi:hypothetical protein
VFEARNWLRGLDLNQRPSGYEPKGRARDPTSVFRPGCSIKQTFYETHLSDWHRTIDKKLQTLDDLYQLLNHDQTNRWMLMLEVTIVLLFVIDLVVLVLGLKGH